MIGIPRRLRTSTWIGLSALLLWGVIIPYGAFRYLGGDVRGLLVLGSEFPHPPALRGAPVMPGLGYDGQFFAALAADPWLRDPRAPTYFDVPAYRAGRAGLPVLAWLVAAGDGPRAVFAYQLLVWILSPLLVWLLARWLEDQGRSPWWAASTALTAGLVSSMYSSLPDAVALLAALLALWLHERSVTGVGAVLAIASWVKDTSLVVAAALAAAEARQRRWRQAAFAVLPPVLLFAAWRAYVATRPGFEGRGGANDGLDIPFAWVPEKLASPIDADEWLALAAIGLTFLGLAAVLRLARMWDPLALAYLAWGILALALSRMVYVPVWWTYARVLLPLPVLAVLLGEKAEPGWRRWILRLVPLAWAALGATAMYRWAAGYLAVLAAGWVIARWPRSTPEAR
jgi:hypothetical protein